MAGSLAGQEQGIEFNDSLRQWPKEKQRWRSIEKYRCFETQKIKI